MPGSVRAHPASRGPRITDQWVVDQGENVEKPVSYKGKIEGNNLCFLFWLKICSLVISCNIQGQRHGNKYVRICKKVWMMDYID